MSAPGFHPWPVWRPSHVRQGLGDLGAFFLPLLLVGGVGGGLLELARRFVKEWHAPTTNKQELRQQELTIRQSILEAYQKGQIDAASLQYLLQTLEGRGEPGSSAAVVRFLEQHGITIAVGVITTVLGAVILRALLK